MSDPAVTTEPQGQPAAPLAPVDLERAVALLFGAVSALVYLRAVEALFPGVGVRALSFDQDVAATTFADGLIRGAAARLGLLASLPPVPLPASREDAERMWSQFRASLVVTQADGQPQIAG